MDPFSAISLAGTIVQFLDFTSKILSQSQQIRKSVDGAVVGHADIELLTKDLLDLHQRLRMPLRPAGATTVLTREESQLGTLCENCDDVARELLSALDNLKIQGDKTKWKSIRKALKSVWNANHLTTLEGRLAKFRDEINTRILASLS
jgi:hypothetical protein